MNNTLKFFVIAALSSTLSTLATAETKTTPEKTTARWSDRISFSGDVDLTGFAANHTPTTVGVIPSNIGHSPAASDLSVTFASVGANAKITDWMKAVLAISYQQSAPSFIRSPSGGGDSLFVDQAYVIFAKPDATPLNLKIGRSFIDFGGIDTTTYLESTTQLLSLMRQTEIELGVDWQGWKSAVYLFRGLDTTGEPNTTRANNYGVNIGFGKKDTALGYNLSAGYVSNIASALYAISTVANGSTLANGYYHHNVPGLDIHACANWNAFDVNVKYIAALTAFSVLDVPYTNNAGLTFSGAKPATWGLSAGYQFDVLSHSGRLGLGYQGSSESAALGKAIGSTSLATAGIYGTSFAIGMPQSRIYANYTVHIVKWAELGFELARDQGYSTNNGGTGRSAYTGLMTVMTHIEG